MADDETIDSLSRDRILNVAEAFARKGGYFCFSVADVAKGARVPKAELRRYFEGKPALATALVKRYTARTFEALGDPEDSGAIPRLVEAYGAVAAQGGEMCLCSLYGAEINGLPQTVAEATRAHYRRLNDWIQRALRCDPQSRQPSAVIAGLCGALLTTKSLNDPLAFETIAWQLIRPVTDSCP